MTGSPSDPHAGASGSRLAGELGRPFAKGHGTENDFVLLVDADDQQELTAAEVRALCDRRAGIGADGVLRAVYAAHSADWSAAPGDPEDRWFMDYRNADGSLAEMCGNGLRVFVVFLLEEGLARTDADGALTVATRAGLRTAWLLPDGRVRVAMGPVELEPGEVTVTPRGGRSGTAVRARIGNPHAVTLLPSGTATDLDDLDLTVAPRWDPTDAFPDGVNLEFVRRLGERHVAVRVFERGSGETRSCGTGVCAVVAVAAHDARQVERPLTYRVEVPGGRVEVELTGDDTFLTGPAVVLARGAVHL